MAQKPTGSAGIQAADLIIWPPEIVAEGAARNPGRPRFIHSFGEALHGDTREIRRAKHRFSGNSAEFLARATTP
jgi:hypothetical protein